MCPEVASELSKRVRQVPMRCTAQRRGWTAGTLAGVRQQHLQRLACLPLSALQGARCFSHDYSAGCSRTFYLPACCHGCWQQGGAPLCPASPRPALPLACNLLASTLALRCPLVLQPAAGPRERRPCSAGRYQGHTAEGGRTGGCHAGSYSTMVVSVGLKCNTQASGGRLSCSWQHSLGVHATHQLPLCRPACPSACRALVRSPSSQPALLLGLPPPLACTAGPLPAQGIQRGAAATGEQAGWIAVATINSRDWQELRRRLVSQ